MTSPERARFDLEIERQRVLAMLAVDRRGDPDVVARLEDELGTVDRQLRDARVAARRADRLFDALGLGELERDLVWAAVAANHPHVAPHLVVLGGSEVRRGLTLTVHAAVARLDRPRAADLALAMHAGHPLFRHHVLASLGDGTAAMRVIAVPPRVVGFLAGNDTLDDALRGAGAVIRPRELELDARQRAAIEQLRIATSSPEPPLIVLEGPSGVGRRTALASAAGREVVVLDLRRSHVRADELAEVTAALAREAILRDAIPLVANIDELAGTEDAASSWRAVTHLLDDVPGVVAASSVQPGIELRTARAILRVPFPSPELTTRRALWRRSVGPGVPGSAIDELAYRYGVGAGGIERAVASARLLAGAAPLAAPHVVQGLRMNIAEQLGALASRVEVTQAWDDAVLASDVQDQVGALIARVRHAQHVLTDWGFARKLARGQGVAALFSGPPGTGKSMVAGLVARELGLDLYQVDLSKVVSKWVGETEKQLARVFDAAEAGHALLLFDEADALFARRTEVKTANDRYANLEVNYLLQRIEAYGGVVILTTNLDASIDPALRRRLAGHIVFWTPDETERSRLWRTMLDASAPVAEDLDFEVLAERWPEMTGANIRNAALAAAFLAASDAKPIGQAHLERAARGEYRAMGRVL